MGTEAAARAATAPAARDYDAIVVGAGFAGLYMLHRLRAAGFSARVLEAGSGVGGTWYWNRYPGARCDIESLDYSYSFSEPLQQEWVWKERYSAQPDILAYLNHVADRFDLRRDIELDTRVAAASFDQATRRWAIETTDGRRFSAAYFIAATGCLSVGRTPEIAGADRFTGRTYHTGTWPADGVDFTGLKVGVIGTGSSGVQAIPEIAKQADHVYVFQRTPNFIVPAWNGPLDPEIEHAVKAQYAERRALSRRSPGGVPFELNPTMTMEATPDERRRELERRWKMGGIPMIFAFADTMTDKRANDVAADFVRDKIRQKVENPAVAEKLLPRDHAIGTKRLCVDTNYFETFNRDNVTLVDLRESPIEEITPGGIRTSSREYALDAIVYATGFDAITGALLRMDIRGQDGRSLREAWAHGPRTYLGLAVAGFPNMFVITGPGSPSVISNMVTSIEQHVEWIADCLTALRRAGKDEIEATGAAQDAWVAHVNEVASHTLYPEARSWYVGANIPGKPRVFMPYVGGVGAYREKCDAVAANGYEGFSLRGR